MPETRGILNVAAADIDGIPGDELLLVGNGGVRVLSIDINSLDDAAEES